MTTPTNAQGPAYHAGLAAAKAGKPDRDDKSPEWRAGWAAWCPTPARKRRAPRQRYASRAEQHARYIDCGTAAWDDIGGAP